jgi:protein-S-isoprenylcysteine O-methyltransferase Ste14
LPEKLMVLLMVFGDFKTKNCSVNQLLRWPNRISLLGLFHHKGTKPEPWKPSSALVSDGVYRFTRNPMYLGMVLLYAGIALIAGGPLTAAALVPVFLIFNVYVIAREEAYLERRFGDEYAAYRSHARRWL